MNAWTANLLKVNHISKRVLRMLDLIYHFQTILTTLHKFNYVLTNRHGNFDAKLNYLFNKQKSQKMNLIWHKTSRRVNIALSNTVKRGTSRSAINGKLQQESTTFSGMYHVFFVRVTKLPAS